MVSRDVAIEWTLTCIGANPCNNSTLSSTYIERHRKWLVDINNNISVMSAKCILIVGIMNNVSVMFNNCIKS